MDESRCPPEASQTQRVIGWHGTKTQHKQGTSNQENVMALVTICADGSALHPTIVFKAKNFIKSWKNNNVAPALYVTSIRQLMDWFNIIQVLLFP